MPTPYSIHKTQAFARGLSGVFMMVLGVAVARPPWQFPLVLLGTWLAAHWFVRVIRLLAAERRLGGDWWSPQQDGVSFASASLPRLVFWLLLAVAEVDGRAESEERELVRRFLLERFRDPITAADLRTWEARRIPREHVLDVALHLQRRLRPSECETVFFWACLVAFADGSFKADEHAILQEVANGLGLAPLHARVVFHQAKAHVLGNRAYAGTWPRWGRRPGRDQRNRPPPNAARAPSGREQALATLGLEPGATEADIRRRHRELVKRHHPDAHTHLGPVAAEEAERRFREVQQAYELLRGS